MCKSVTIESCTEGFIVYTLDSNGLKTKERYAVSQDKLIQKVKELLGITDKSKAVVWAGTKIESMKSKPELLISDSSDSTFPRVNSAMTGAYSPERPATEINSQSKIETKLSPSSQFVFKEIAAFEVSCQPTTKDKAIYWLHPGGKKIKISRENYQIMIYANISDLVYLYEHPAEQKTIIAAYGKATYDNKAVVLRGFMKDVPLSALVDDNHHDESITTNKEEPKGQEDGNCDDVAFESCANNTPEQCIYCIDQSRYENKNKLAAKKPAPPLMKASVSP